VPRGDLHQRSGCALNAGWYRSQGHCSLLCCNSFHLPRRGAAGPASCARGCCSPCAFSPTARPYVQVPARQAPGELQTSRRCVALILAGIRDAKPHACLGDQQQGGVWACSSLERLPAGKEPQTKATLPGTYCQRHVAYRASVLNVPGWRSSAGLGRFCSHASGRI
jgi:hypothetical protein